MKRAFCELGEDNEPGYWMLHGWLGGQQAYERATAREPNQRQDPARGIEEKPSGSKAARSSLDEGTNVQMTNGAARSKSRRDTLLEER